MTPFGQSRSPGAEGAPRHRIAPPSLADLEAAARVVYAAMDPTPQYRWPLLDTVLGTEVWVKHENHTPIGAFKLRGGLVYMDQLRRSEPDVEAVVTATRGNHGQAVGFAARLHGLQAAVVVPHGNSADKNAAMRALGVELIEEGTDFQAAAEAADGIAVQRGWHRLPSFHPWLVRGSATYALELFRAVPNLDVVYVPVGLGSGICGVIAARDALDLPTEVVAVVSDEAPALALSLDAGRMLSHAVSTRIADGMACRTPVEEAVATITRGAQRVVRVGDDDVEEAMRTLFTCTHNVAEGAGAAALAALSRERPAIRGRRVAIVLTGGNVDRPTYARVLSEDRR